ncbi:CLUMA_CG000494, isoform A [Clunio marinus]|uniref:CLUMA_CG000494, isoform A n=1 Tax=Clunio marinus TaxID=568069 RepID=A0A1J1HGI3_9DIPT|nr:CLUMA_CG000494, isoform A [Clunio marinus]
MEESSRVGMKKFFKENSRPLRKPFASICIKKIENIYLHATCRNYKIHKHFAVSGIHLSTNFESFIT